MDNSILVAGTSHTVFAKEISAHLGKPLHPVKILYFPDGECRVHLRGDIRGKQVVILQTLARRPNDFLIETMLIADAARRSGAQSIIFACPYLAYSRQNLPEEDGASLAARLFAHFLHEAGISQLVTMDLHAEHIPSFYDFPVHHLSAASSLVRAFRDQHEDIIQKLVVVGPDLGSAKLVGHYAEELQSDFALIQKKRYDARHVEVHSLVGDVKNKYVLLADDMCTTASTLESAAKLCREKGAKKVFACVTHGLFVEDALKRIQASELAELFVTNTIAQDERAHACEKICVVSVSAVFAAALLRHMR